MKILLLLLSLLLASPFAFGEVYKWVDEKGEVHYQDHPRGIQGGKISVDDSHAETVNAQDLNKLKTQKLIKAMEKSRKQREKSRHKKLAAQRKQDERCLKLRDKVRKQEARMQKHYSEFSNDRPPSYQRQQAELADHKKYLDKYCN
jgi:hypothetical protein